MRNRDNDNNDNDKTDCFTPCACVQGKNATRHQTKFHMQTLAILNFYDRWIYIYLCNDILSSALKYYFHTVQMESLMILDHWQKTLIHAGK